MRITQKDIAIPANVSPMTVSLALRDSPRLSSETRRHVQEVAKENGYRPDPVLAALNAYRIGDYVHRFQGVIAWVTAFSTPSDWRSMVQTERTLRCPRKSGRIGLPIGRVLD